MATETKNTFTSIVLLAIGAFFLFCIQSCKPDLIVEISGPSSVSAGRSPDTVTVDVKNVGNAMAPGTITKDEQQDSDGYMIDIVLSSDNNLPVQFGIVSDTFREDMLLRGGRISRTQDLAPGGRKTYTLSAPALLIPADTPQGDYCLGAVVDPGKKVEESHETNNTACHNISISQEEPMVTTVVIVRHAERSNDALTEDGEKRAETLAHMLNDSGVSVVFSTNTTRTRETANNTADRLDIPIQYYEYSGAGIDSVINLIKSQHIGKVILVVGHSPTVPIIIRALGISSVPTCYEFNNLFIVTICSDGIASLTHLKYEIHRDLYFSDPNESDVPDGKDFKNLNIKLFSNNVSADIYFYDSLNLSEFFFYFDNDNDCGADFLIKCRPAEFKVYKASIPGLYNDLKYSGMPNLDSNHYHLEFPLSALELDRSYEFTTYYWFFAMDGRDRMPNSGKKLLANIR